MSVTGPEVIAAAAAVLLGSKRLTSRRSAFILRTSRRLHTGGLTRGFSFLRMSCSDEEDSGGEWWFNSLNIDAIQQITALLPTASLLALTAVASVGTIVMKKA